MHLTTGYETRKARIEIVPLLDVVFLLLVFFIYAMLSMTVHRGVSVALPTASGSMQDSRSMVITLNSESELMIEDQPVSLDDAVAEAVAASKEGSATILIRGDRTANLGIAIELLSRLRHAGLTTVSFAVKDSLETGTEP
jgi:biopolymer transport protein ExbD